MPLLGPDNPVLGYLAFCAVKFAGYALAGYTIGQAYRQPKPNAAAVGAVRTLIGMAAGCAYFYAFHAFTKPITSSSTSEFQLLTYYLLGLVPVRLLEWWIIVWGFYDRQTVRLGLDGKVVAGGTLWSFALDLPALLGFCVTGGVSVC